LPHRVHREELREGFELPVIDHDEDLLDRTKRLQSWILSAPHLNAVWREDFAIRQGTYGRRRHGCQPSVWSKSSRFVVGIRSEIANEQLAYAVSMKCEWRLAPEAPIAIVRVGASAFTAVRATLGGPRLPVIAPSRGEELERLAAGWTANLVASRPRDGAPGLVPPCGSAKSPSFVPAITFVPMGRIEIAPMSTIARIRGFLVLACE
jgi:hypothetical protein